MRRPLLAALLAVAAGPAVAQQQNFDAVTIKPELLAPGIAVLFGAGGNIGVSYGPDGTVLIDDQFAPLTPKIEAAVAALPATPVKFLINTHWHGDHSGGNENFGKAGAVILAHDHVRERMSAEQNTSFGKIAASPPAALPVITYHDGVKIHLNGDVVRTMHVPHAHTDGDSIVFWEKAKVVHMGDTFVNGGMPFIDLASGGSAQGLLKAADKVLSMIDDSTRIIPGHGPIATKGDLARYRAMIAEVVAAVESHKAAGKTLEQVVAMKLAAKYDTNPQAFIKGDAFVTAIWQSLEKPPHDHGGGEHSHGPEGKKHNH